LISGQSRGHVIWSGRSEEFFQNAHQRSRRSGGQHFEGEMAGLFSINEKEKL